MLELHYSPGAISFCVHWALIEARIPFKARLVNLSVGEQNSAAYRAINPRGKVPAIQLNGACYGESAALLMWISEQPGGKNLAPSINTPQRLEWLEWMLTFANGLLPPLGDWLYAEKNVGVENAALIKQAASEKMDRFWQEIGEHLSRNQGSFFLGERLSTVDCIGAMIMFWSVPTAASAAREPKIYDYMKRVQNLWSFEETCRREGMTNLLAPSYFY